MVRGGAEARDHGTKRAEEIFVMGLEAFGISESELPQLKKSSDEKALIASIIRTNHQFWAARSGD